MKQNGWLVCGLHPVGPLRTLQHCRILRRLRRPSPASISAVASRYAVTSAPRWETLSSGDLQHRRRRSRTPYTWNQPDQMFRPPPGPATTRTGPVRQRRFTYRPDFSKTKRRRQRRNKRPSRFELPSSSHHPTSPGASTKRGANGLRLTAISPSPPSPTRAKWHNAGRRDAQALTDRVKGHRHYWLRLNATAGNSRTPT